MAVNSVSIIICTFNRSGLLADTLRTLAQSLSTHRQPIEVMVVNNASTDDTDAVVSSFMKEAPALSIRLLQENRKGVSFARNTGLEHARGNVLCFLDDDVIVPYGWLEGLLSAFALSNDVGAVAGHIKLHIPDFPRPEWLDSRYYKLFGSFYLGERPCLRKRGEDIHSGNCAFTRKAITAVGPFNTELGRKQNSLQSGEDTEYAKRLWEKGFTIAYSYEGYIYHRVQPERMTYQWIARNYFWTGVANSLSRQWYYPLSVLPRLLSSGLLVFFGLLIINEKRYVLSSFRVINAIGALYGMLLKMKRSFFS